MTSEARSKKPKLEGQKPSIYCTKSPAFKGAIMHPDKRIPFEQNLAPGQNLADSSKVEDLSPCAKGERKKELLVIVKRGKGVDYEQRDTLNRSFEGRRLCSWKDIQEIQKEVPKEEKIHAQFGRTDHTDDSYPVEVDNYADVDDYQY
ncbi:hypothetical protein IWZ03DRAFT_403239 [Phyllosticta citriasiana]|uniref:Uncharacterized protein n=2 Tax=Phyllosticta citriasiana TaxID=595635 RepID=A0ABR1KZB3_9PEZI